ncbi:replication factor C subunit 1, putative [Plasmodium ovale]|uniref:Replication factor C subunit 1 n=1 Tax=Plasmodium ovale TaxID=36330 RepID=A0A1D3RD07_PLAOA|nr:replication factor C subunit 1, putative [Plasmodium ovale]
MSSKGKKPFHDDSSDVGRKRKRLKKLSSNLFDDDEDDDFFNYEGKDKSKGKNIVEIKDDSEVEGENNTTSNVNKTFEKKTSGKPVYYDITSYFKPSSKKVESKSGIKKSISTDGCSGGSGNKIPVKNVSEYFDLLERDSRHAKSESTKSESVHSIMKRERDEDAQEAEAVEEGRFKKKQASPGKDIKGNIKQKNGNKVGDNNEEKFDYLPFNNLKFVLTGVFKNFSRDELQNKIKEHGGSVMSAVSSRTHYLIHGEYLEDGRLYNEGKKYQKAFELSQQSKSIIKILNEEQLLELFPQNKKENNKDNSEVKFENENFTKKEENDYNSTYKNESDSYNNSNSYEKEKEKDINESSDNNNMDKNKILNQLWVEKYRPKNLNELVGNNQNVLKLKNWLNSWEDICIKGLKKQVTKTFRGVYENVNARCALLSGSAGIGKTTTAKIVSENSGYNVIEFNASDERNKAAVEKISEMATGGYSIASIKSRKLKKTCIIMDEVDGMSSGDKGGSAAILKLIEKTKCPIICICNDRQNNKMRTLANKCYDLKFTLPNKNSVVKRLLEICKKENIMMEPNALELLWESANGDMRQMLNTLQLLSRTYKRIQFLDLKKELNNSNKNVQSLANPFEITLKLLNFHESSKLKVREIMDLFFVDYELIPYFISENYTNVFNDNDKSVNAINKWNTFSQISYDLSLADKIKYNMKTTMDFSLLPHFSILSCVCPVMRIKLLKSFMSGRINFPSAFGKISTYNKNKRLLNELCFNISYKLNVCPKHMVTSGFLNYVYFKIMTPLHKNNITESIELMEKYNITKEIITENISCLRLPTQENLYDKLDSKVKASFTRLYNASHVIKNDPNAIRKGLKSSEKKTVFKNNEYESDEDMDELSESKEDKEEDVLINTKIDKKATMKSKSAAKPKPARKK